MKNYWCCKIARRDVRFCLAVCLILFGANNAALAEESASSAAQELVRKAVSAAGGEAQQLKLFRMKERYSSGTEYVSPGTARESVIEIPDRWWLGTTERGKEPAKTVAWAWTRCILTDAKSKVELIADITDNDKLLAGLRVTVSVTPALEMYFDKNDHSLVRVDWRNDIFRFSEPKEYDGFKYPSKCVLYKRDSGKPWFFHEIVSLERLKKLPEDLKK